MAIAYPLDSKAGHGSKVGDRVRFAIHCAEAWRLLGWVRVGRDGSIYLGLLTGRPCVAKYVGKPAGRGKKILRCGVGPLIASLRPRTARMPWPRGTGARRCRLLFFAQTFTSSQKLFSTARKTLYTRLREKPVAIAFREATKLSEQDVVLIKRGFPTIVVLSAFSPR